MTENSALPLLRESISPQCVRLPQLLLPKRQPPCSVETPRLLRKLVPPGPSLRQLVKVATTNENAATCRRLLTRSMCETSAVESLDLGTQSTDFMKRDMLL